MLIHFRSGFASEANRSRRGVGPQRQEERLQGRWYVIPSESFLYNIILTLIPEIDLSAIAQTSSAVLTASPVSPVAVRGDHDNKQTLIHVSPDYPPKNRSLITLALSQSV